MYRLLVILLLLYLNGCRGHPKLLVISLDGFRHDYFSKVRTPTLKSLIDNGVFAPKVKNVFITKTMPNHYSISTGLYVESHGLVANYIYDPDLDKAMNPFEDGDAFIKNTMGEPIWILNERAGEGRYSGGNMWPGTPFQINSFSITYVQTFNKTMDHEEKMDIVVDWFTDEDKPANLVMLYFPETDRAGHMYGPDSEEVKEAIVKVDKALRLLLRKLSFANLLQDLNIIIVSDHGMASCPHDKVIDLGQVLNGEAYDYYSSSPVLLINPKQGMETDVYNNLSAAAKEYNFSVYYKDDIPDEWHYKHNRRIQKILLMSDLGYSFRFHPNETMNLGNHGWNNSFEEMQTFFIGYGPAFKQNYIKKELVNLVDIYPLMCHLLQLSPAVHNGSLSNMKDMLVEPVSWIYILSGSTIMMGMLVAVLLCGTLVLTISCLYMYNKKKTLRRNIREENSSYSSFPLVWRRSSENSFNMEVCEEEGDSEEQVELLASTSDQ